MAGIFNKFALRWMSFYLTDYKFTLVQVMTWCCHYPCQCWSIFCHHMVSLGHKKLNPNLANFFFSQLPYHFEVLWSMLLCSVWYFKKIRNWNGWNEQKKKHEFITTFDCTSYIATNCFRAWNNPLPNSLGQVKLSVRQVDLSTIFLWITYNLFWKIFNSVCWAGTNLLINWALAYR